MSEEPSEHLTVFSSETVSIIKLANLTANTKNHGQVTVNTKPYSDSLSVGILNSMESIEKRFLSLKNVIE